jgi:hypothetical protein
MLASLSSRIAVRSVRESLPVTCLPLDCTGWLFNEVCRLVGLTVYSRWYVKSLLYKATRSSSVSQSSNTTLYKVVALS